jgi:hypothetical protein
MQRCSCGYADCRQSHSARTASLHQEKAEPTEQFPQPIASERVLTPHRNFNECPRHSSRAMQRAASTTTERNALELQERKVYPSS